MSKKALIEGIFQMEKTPGKGGWTYVRLPEVSSGYRGKFGTVRMSGTIDDFSQSGRTPDTAYCANHRYAFEQTKKIRFRD